MVAKGATAWHEFYSDNITARPKSLELKTSTLINENLRTHLDTFIVQGQKYVIGRDKVLLKRSLTNPIVYTAHSR